MWKQALKNTLKDRFWNENTIKGLKVAHIEGKMKNVYVYSIMSKDQKHTTYKINKLKVMKGRRGRDRPKMM